MRKILLGLLMLLPVGLLAQPPVYTEKGNITTSSSTCTASGPACVLMQMSANVGMVAVQVSGTYTGTNEFEGSADSGDWSSIQCVLSADGSLATSTTSTGLWQCPAGGLNFFRVRASALSMGTAVVVIQSSTASARKAPGGPGSGTVTSVATTSPITGGTITTTGTIACATCLAATSLTATRVPFASAAHTLVDDSDMTFATDTLTVTKLVASTNLKAPLYLTTTNCADSAGDAACSAAPAGSVVMDAAASTTVVSTTAVTANSQIFIQEDSSLGTRLSVTCNTTIARIYNVTARTAGTSFTITASAAPVANPACLSYFIVN